MIVLDTSALIDLFRGGEEVKGVIGGDVTTTIINYYEIFVGIRRYRSRTEEKFFRRFFSDIRILDFNLTAAERSSEIMARLMDLGISINAFDILISGIAVASGGETLMTKDRDFLSIAKVTELNIKVY
ncbi:MAG: type II toxin-antitoxin system VapC family toxin [Methanothrix soehngenii]|uniref:type II toxin-antitoxin system VapC family toxin n=1 Tax=Methanothrix soehngenii TaxID=2223 RepID=UPI0023F050A8|nr:type II toxin-antitoxin system VapC family toxin [Methanothrix soehngenii]MDD5256275.1 type II toxin-antitoxin system VapC family toxin [Methanothrix soehngenii]